MRKPIIRKDKHKKLIAIVRKQRQRLESSQKRIEGLECELEFLRKLALQMREREAEHQQFVENLKELIALSKKSIFIDMTNLN
jgi:hypothetical protein